MSSKTKSKSKEFVTDSSDGSNEEDLEPKQKKTKKAKQKKVEEDEEKGDGPPFELGSRKKVSINSFKGKTLIDIREYYDAGGQEKPGKKGISLSVDQWNSLKKYISQIDKEISNL